MSGPRVTIVPAWRLPHEFVHVRAAREKLPDPASVFSYGLLLPEVIRAETFLEPRVRMRVGVDWIGTLIARRPYGSIDPPPPGSISHYFLEHKGEIERGRIGLIPKKLLDQLDSPAADEGRAYIRHHLGRFLDDLNTAADNGIRPSDDPALVDAARTFPVAFGPRLYLRRYKDRKTGKPVYGFQTQTLIEQLSIEVQDLYLHRPTLRRCVACEGIFVPLGNELNCRWGMWQADTSEPLKQCMTDAEVEQAKVQYGPKTTTRERRRKRLDQRVRRARERVRAHPANSFYRRKLDEAQSERTAFRDEYGKRKPGPRGEPLRATVETQPTDDAATIKPLEHDD